MFYTDTHAHLHSKELRNKADLLIKSAKDENIKRIITVGTKLTDSRNAVELAQKRSGVYATVGVHPHYAADFDFRSLGELEKMAGDKKVLAVGEVGLDYYRNISPKEKQIEVFTMMADLALGVNLPLIIHAREAAEDILKVLDSVYESDHKILFHCFSGEQCLIDWGLARQNVRFSFAGNVTYPKAVELHNALAQIPVERLFIETDCPYLSPIPLRGKENQPAYIVHTAQFVAEKKGVTTEKLQLTLEKSFTDFFGEHPATL